MAFSRYIYELLLDNEVVIIPDFGAFITWILPARIDEVSGTLIPPSKVVRFDPKIRNNDWLLVNYISETEGISEHDALKKIRKSCDEFLYRLDSGEQVVFEKTGTLFFDSDKELCFEQDKQASLLLNSYGLDPVPVIPAENQSEKPSNDKLTGSAGERQVSYWWVLVFIPIIIGTYVLIQKFRKSEVQEIIEIETGQKYPIQDTLKADSGFAAEKDTSKPIEHLLPVPEEIKTKADTISGRKYYVIGGSFAGEENARKYISRMERKGYKPFIVEKKGRLNIVAIDVYNNLKEAGDLKRQLLGENPDSGIWILVE